MGEPIPHTATGHRPTGRSGTAIGTGPSECLIALGDGVVVTESFTAKVRTPHGIVTYRSKDKGATWELVDETS